MYSILNNGLKEISVQQFEVITEDSDALILDTRSNGDFAKGFVPQSINIGVNGDFAPWVGVLIADVNQPIVLVTDLGKEEESVMRLSRVGFDNILGHLKGGFEAWKSNGFDVDSVNRITAEQFEKEVKIGESKVVDIRKESEYEAEHLEDAYSKPLAYINDWVKDINPNEHFFMHCAGGYRSMIAASILQARGYRNFFLKLKVDLTPLPKQNYQKRTLSVKVKFL